MNPEIDIGQVEGSFIMGLGYWLTEQAIYDPTTGLQLNTGTWVCECLITRMVRQDLVGGKGAQILLNRKSGFPL